jgi:hypothetical protein
MAIGLLFLQIRMFNPRFDPPLVTGSLASLSLAPPASRGEETPDRFSVAWPLVVPRSS